jgi:hypothetical protein
MSIMMPALQQAKGLARTVICKNNNRQLTFGQLMYEQDHGVFAYYTAGGNSPIRQVYPYLQTDSLWNPTSSAMGEQVNHEPYLCPELRPAVKNTPQGQPPNRLDLEFGNMFPMSWNIYLGHYYFNQPSKPRYKLKGTQHIKRPSEIIGWADSAADVINGKEWANTGALHPPGSYGWYNHYMGNDVVVFRHGSRSLNKAVAANRDIETQDAHKYKKASVTYLDGHSGTINLEDSRDQSIYFIGEPY